MRRAGDIVAGPPCQSFVAENVTSLFYTARPSCVIIPGRDEKAARIIMEFNERDFSRLVQAAAQDGLDQLAAEHSQQLNRLAGRPEAEIQATVGWLLGGEGGLDHAAVADVAKAIAEGATVDVTSAPIGWSR